MRRRLARLESEAAAPAKLPGEGRSESSASQAVEDYLTELAIYRGELEEADVSNLEESRRRADEAYGELVDEWRRLGIWGA